MLDKHVFIAGITGSGKTVFASKLYDELPTINIFINTSEEYNIDRITEKSAPPEKGDGQTINHQNIPKMIENGFRKIDVVPNPTTGELNTSTVEEIIKLMFKIAYDNERKTKRRITKFWCTIFIDEIQEYCPKPEGNPVIERLFKRGRRWGIRGIAISQRPADVDHTILTQCKEHIIFQLNNYDAPYFERYNIPVEEHKEHLDKPYHWIYFDGKEVTEYMPIEEP